MLMCRLWRDRRAGTVPSRGRASHVSPAAESDPRTHTRLHRILPYPPHARCGLAPIPSHTCTYRQTGKKKKIKVTVLCLENQSRSDRQ